MSEMNWQLIGFGVTQLVTIVSAFFGLKATISQLGHDFKLAMAEERADRVALIASEKADMMTLVAKVETYVHDLTHRVSTLEAGQDEWTKALRQRTHELANDLQTLVLKVDRLERPR